MYKTRSGSILNCVILNGLCILNVFVDCYAVSLSLEEELNAFVVDATCFTNNGNIGICIPVGGCDDAIHQLERKIHPETCGFKKTEPLVCCNKAGIRSKKYCASHYEFDYTEDYSPYLAVGGEVALPKEFPHMAALGFGEKESIKWRCGGSLISDQYVLTAAHCLRSRDLGFAKWVRLGDLNINITTDDADPQDFEVDSFIRHPDYKAPSRYHDIALVKLDRPVKFTDYVQPVCLETRKDLDGTDPTATGWGKLAFEEDTSPDLQKVNLDYFTKDECRVTYDHIPPRQLANGIDDETQLCAGGRNEERDTCQGDSGGPLQISNRRYPIYYNQVGITSFGIACGLENTPGVYTRVSYYVPWIEDIVWPED